MFNKTKAALAGAVVAFSVLTAGMAAAQTTVTYNATGAAQTFVVPAGVTSVDIVAQGAQGFDASSGAILGGRGGRAAGRPGRWP